MQVWRNICVDLCCHSMYCLPEHYIIIHDYCHDFILSWSPCVLLLVFFLLCLQRCTERLGGVYCLWSCFALPCIHLSVFMPSSTPVALWATSPPPPRLKPEQLLPLPALHSWSCLVSAFGFNKHLRSVTLMACFEQRLTSSRQKRWTSLALHYVTYVTSWAHSVSSCHSLCEWGERGCILPDLHTQNKNRSRSSHCVSGLSQFYFGLITKDCWHITLEYTRDVCTFLLHACRTDNTNISSPQLWRNVSV